jgi:hypothetical protein
MNIPLLSQDAINEIYNKKIDSETKLSVLKDLNNKVKEQKLPENFITYQEYKDSLIKRLEKNKLFDFRWSSLISSNPLLFEDNHYLRIKKLVRFNKEQYEKEQEMFRNGEINHIYSSLDQLLLCNLKYYDRIMNYALQVFEKYIMLPDDEDGLSDEEMFKDVIQELEMTPTQLYCASMINPETTTIRELEYGFSLKKGSIKPITEEDIEDGITSIIQKNWNTLYKHPNFRLFTQLNALRLQTDGFRSCWVNEHISNDKMGQVCRKFTRMTLSVTKTQLKSVHRYIEEIDEIQHSLYQALYKCMMHMFDFDDNKFSIYVYTNDFYLFTERFNMRVSKNIETGAITKEYLSNSYECFAAEEYLAKSIKEQIRWAKYQEPMVYQFDKTILKGILLGLLEDNFRDVVLLKRPDKSSADGTVSKVTFSGIFKMVKIKETFMFRGKEIYSTTKTLSKFNAANYLINRGYYFFGMSDDIVQFIDMNEQNCVKHYSRYTIPVAMNVQKFVNNARKYHNEMEEIIKNNKLPDNIVIKEPIHIIDGPANVRSDLFNDLKPNFMYMKEKRIFREQLKVQEKMMGFVKNRNANYWIMKDINLNI